MPSPHVVSHVCYRATLSCQQRVIWPCFTSFRFVPFRTLPPCFICGDETLQHDRVWLRTKCSYCIASDRFGVTPYDLTRIVKITAFWDSTPSLSKECPTFRQIVVTSSSEPSWDCLTLTTKALRLFETSGPTYLTTYPGSNLYFT